MRDLLSTSDNERGGNCQPAIGDCQRDNIDVQDPETGSTLDRVPTPIQECH
jgi:hypothetical protein